MLRVVGHRVQADTAPVPEWSEEPRVHCDLVTGVRVMGHDEVTDDKDGSLSAVPSVSQTLTVNTPSTLRPETLKHGIRL